MKRSKCNVSPAYEQIWDYCDAEFQGQYPCAAPEEPPLKSILPVQPLLQSAVYRAYLSPGKELLQAALLYADHHRSAVGAGPWIAT